MPTPSQQPSRTESQGWNNNSPISAEFEDQITDEKDGSHFDFNIDQSLLNNLLDKLSKFYNKHIDKPLEERNYDVKNLQTITQEEWQIANYIIEKFISNKITMDLWNVNVIQYGVILDKNDSLKEENTKPDKHTKPRWLDQQKINNIR